MNSLDALVRAAEGELDRQLQICNACRYCEGFCAVFPAMTRRLEFTGADAHYLSNLCHNCGACLHACQYAPPHEFAVNIPQATARVRRDTYVEYAWPRALGALYKRNGLTVAIATAGGISLFMVLALALRGTLSHEPMAGNFYAIFPHNLLVLLFGVVFGWVVLALGIGVTRFWRGQSPGTGFRMPAPYPFLSLPVILGTVGGVGLLIGPAGLFWLNLRRHPMHGDARQAPMDRGFIVLLFVTSLTGLALLAFRGTGAMALLLAVHLGAVMALFLTMPYGKFAHGLYRSAALLKWAIERRQPNRLQLGAE